MLNNNGASSDLRPGDHIVNSALGYIATPKLTVDRQIEHGTVLDASLAIKEEANCPDLLLGERSLGADPSLMSHNHIATM